MNEVQNKVRKEDAELLTERIGEVFTKGESSVEALFLAKDGSLTPYLFNAPSPAHSRSALIFRAPSHACIQAKSTRSAIVFSLRKIIQ